MSGQNGHSNGHTNGHANDHGRNIRPTSGRELRDLCKAVFQGWLAKLGDPRIMDEAIQALRDAIKDDRNRGMTKVLASKALIEAAQQSAALAMRHAEFEDKTDRLDSGQDTERIGGLTVVIQEAKPPTDRVSMED